MKVLVLGAGQLARMMALAGAPLNIEVLAYDVGSGQVVHPLTQQLMMKGLDTAVTYADVITAEFEHIPHNILEVCEASGKLQPTTQAIKAGGDRRLEKKLLDRASVASARYQIINNRDDLEQAVNTVGIPMVLKGALGGYDGKGQWRFTSVEQADQLWQEISPFLAATPDQAIVAEEFVPFDREVSLIGARGKDGSIAVYPLTENTHHNGVLSLSVAGKTDSQLQSQAETMFKAVAETLDYVGVLAIEFFDVGGKLLVNEIAPRVHNSGHWTQQGAETCQFENHLRAVCGLPLGNTTLLRSTAMVNILGEDTLADEILSLPQCHVHWYGKEKRPGRKMGHINVCANSLDELNDKLGELAVYLDPAAFPVLCK
ncbi:Phosphoribosylaminoimidazole carboxylase ATPase subunit [Photobacterium marinum]|uniref:N5-carboxyaminoimidazole ribonucleotide synthase n=1 Tax=Photobacterium marinum TaxID=1056511 RepID=L8J4K7_9GAMM|nr:5-(carboxyamino)imidazole ribonucleotide synthase [Photobacterium marinum]ELR63148.1 Phosphoribosylaminoimidazole carboxylase ATPase subunit [Photobacterium marinum]